MVISAQHKINIPVKKILIIQLGDIGDVVWAIPTFWALKAAFPEAALSVLTRNPNGNLLLDDPHIYKVFQVGKDGVLSDFQLLIKLRREKYDLMFDLRADDRGTVIAFLTGAKMRCALHYPGMRWRDKAFTHLLQEPPPRERIYGAAEQSLRIVRGFGINEVTYAPRIFISEKIKKKTEKLLADENIGTEKAWVSINPFSRWAYKEWDMDKWRQLIIFIWQKYKMPVVIIGSTAEKQRADALTATDRSPIYDLAGKTTLREMAALLQMSRLHIGVDSAAPHIATAVGTPTLTIYGPTNWRDWVLPGGKNKVVLPDMDCSPCHKKGCDDSGRSDCLDKLTVAKVQEAVETMLDNNLAI
jgi:ADP-heptose:LPS heptosyltransferase